MFDELVEFVQVYVGEELACPVAKRHTCMGDSCFVVVKYYSGEPEYIVVFHIAVNDVEEYILINCFKVVVDIRFENITSNVSLSLSLSLAVFLNRKSEGRDELFVLLLFLCFLYVFCFFYRLF